MADAHDDAPRDDAPQDDAQQDLAAPEAVTPRAAEATAPDAAPAASATPAAPEAAAPDGPAVVPDTAPPTAPAPAPAPKPAPAPRAGSPEPAERVIEVPSSRLVAQARRDFLLFGAGALAAATGAWFLLPDRTKGRLLPGAARDRLDSLAARVGLTRERRERVLDRALTFDDDVAEALYSPRRLVRTYSRADVTPLRNNYDGRTPDAAILANWVLELRGLKGGGSARLALPELLARFRSYEQVTRFVCVEGWSAIAWWQGLRFADLLAAFPPRDGARWAAMRSDVNLDRAGRSNPYYVSIDLGTAMHPQTLLATHWSGAPLPLAHGAPLRLLVPVKLGLKNIKAITSIEFGAHEPPDYWNERGYSRYDGL